MAQPKTLLVFDIETVPDVQFHVGDGFPKHVFHQVVAIGFLEAEIEKLPDGHEAYHLRELRCGGEVSFTEKQLVEGFFHYFERTKPKLVSFNGRSFDLPVLKYRAMKHGVSVPWLYRAGDRYSNYTYRYSAEWHCDLMDVLSDFGAVRSLKLDEVSQLIGLPGKFGVDGSMVKPMYDEGRIGEIRDYCETDVLNTYLVFLRYMHLTGTLTKDGHNKAVADVVTYIDAEKGKRSHLAEFMAAWGEASGENFLLT